MREDIPQGLRVHGAKHRRVPFRIIVEATCAVFRVTEAELLGRGRHESLIAARRVCVAIAREHTIMSYPDIAEACGHTSWSSWVYRFKAYQRHRNDKLSFPLRLRGKTLEQARDTVCRRARDRMATDPGD